MEHIEGPHGLIAIYVAAPAGAAQHPAVVVVHDALGMSNDVQAQAQWLADAGYLAVAPDLFSRGRMRCMMRTMRDLQRGAQGLTFDELAHVQQWALNHPRSSGKIGIIGFCFGGGIALMLAPDHGYAASAVNYGGMAESGWERLQRACPIVASYGADDPTLKGTASRLESVLSEHNIPHDVKQYPGVGHGFMNDHRHDEQGLFIGALARLSNTRYDPVATADARKRILTFFETHLRGAAA